MNLSERLRGVLSAGKPVIRQPDPPAARDSESLCRDLGGQWQGVDSATRCFVVERRTVAASVHGAVRVGVVAADLESAAGQAALFAGSSPIAAPFLFFDLETTGLSGGAGTYAFLVGCGWFDATGDFLTRQYFLTRHGDERPLLHAFAGELAKAGALVSFNGKSFDAPVLETRYLFHRLEWTGSELPHLDVLHPARRFWGDGSGCSLSALEEQVLGARRVGDVPGHEIPARYFQFVRSGDARPLAAVLEHNRLDLLSLAGMTARLLRLAADGADATRTSAEAAALGRVYQRAGLDTRAHASYERALDLLQRAREVRRGPAALHDGAIEAEALQSLAILARRARRFGDAAEWWSRLLDAPGCPGPAMREASEALAIHHEHRVRDLRAARTFALRSLDVFDQAHNGHHTARAAAVQHRVARIDRKLTDAAGMSVRLELGD